MYISKLPVRQKPTSSRGKNRRPFSKLPVRQKPIHPKKYLILGAWPNGQSTTPKTEIFTKSSRERGLVMKKTRFPQTVELTTLAKLSKNFGLFKAIRIKNIQIYVNSLLLSATPTSVFCSHRLRKIRSYS